jgi:ribonuclease HI
MVAHLWISKNLCRILIYADNGSVIDTNNEWNNRASAESWVNQYYPEAKQKFYSRDVMSEIKRLDEEWNSCVHGT